MYISLSFCILAVAIFPIAETAHNTTRQHLITDEKINGKGQNKNGHEDSGRLYFHSIVITENESSTHPNRSHSKRLLTVMANHNRTLFSRTIPSDDDRKTIRRGNKTCQRITCLQDHYVRSCNKDGDSDTCVPCPDGFHLPDVTSSRAFNFNCTPAKQECLPEAIYSDVTYYCDPDFPMKCVCDTSRNFCSVDPCHCIKKHCPYGRLLQVNCGCDRVVQTAPASIATTAATTQSPKVTVRSTWQTTRQPSTPIAEQTSETTTDRPTTRPTTSTTQSTQSTEAPYHPDHEEIKYGLAIGFTLLGSVMIGLAIIWFCTRKPRTTNYQNIECVQQGKYNTIQIVNEHAGNDNVSNEDV